MMKDPEQYDQNKKELNHLLQSAVSKIKEYINGIHDKSPKVIAWANRINDLCQRRTFAGYDPFSDTSTRLLYNVLEAYQNIKDTLDSFKDILNKLEDDVSEFECRSLSLTADLPSLKDKELSNADAWNNWLINSKNILNTHSKFLEVSLRTLNPQIVEKSSILSFKKNLDLNSNIPPSLHMGLAYASHNLAPDQFMPLFTPI